MSNIIQAIYNIYHCPVYKTGEHYYAKIGKLDVVDEQGNQKWNTKREAEAAARWYIEKYW